MSIALLMDFLLIGLLCATCAYCIQLNRRLKVLKDGQTDLHSAIKVFDEASAQARDMLERIEENGVSHSRGLEAEMSKASALASELSVMVSAGDNIAARIERAMNEVRAVGIRRHSDTSKLEQCA